MLKHGLIITVGCGLLVGWGIGRLLRPVAPRPSEVVGATVSDAPKHEAAELPPVKRPAQDPTLQERWDFANEVKSAAASMLETHLSRTQQLTDPVERAQRLEIIAMRCAEVDPKKFLAKFMSQDRDFAQDILLAWGALDGQGSLGWAQSLEGLADRKFAYGTMIKGMAAVDPQGLLKMVKEGSLGMSVPPETLGTALTALTKRDPEQAIKELTSLPPSPMRQRCFDTVSEVWAHQDPQAALRWAKGLGDLNDRTQALCGALRAMAETDPRAARDAVDLLAAHKDMRVRLPHGAIALGLARENLDEAEAWVKSLDPTRHHLEQLLTQFVLPAMEKVDAQSLLKLFGSVEVGGRNADFSNPMNLGRGLLSVLVNWKPEDLQGAWNQASAQPPTPARESVLNYLAWQLASADPAAALAQAEAATGDPVGRARLAQHLSEAFAKAGDTEKLKAALALTNDPAQQSTAINTAATTLAKENPGLAEQFLDSLPPAARASGLATMAPMLVARDPEAAAGLAASLTTEDAVVPISLVAAEWAKFNIAAATAFAGKFETGAKRDAATAGLVGAMHQSHPKEVLKLVKSISDSEIRAAQLQTLLHSWMEADAQAARSALAVSGLAEKEIAAALIPPPDGHPNPEVRNRDAAESELEGSSPEP